MNPDALAAWGLWKRTNHIEQERDVTGDVEDLLYRAGGWSAAPVSTHESAAGTGPKTLRATLSKASEWQLYMELAFYRELLERMHRFVLATMAREPTWSVEQVLGHVEAHLAASHLELHPLEAEWLLKELRKALSY